MADNNKYHVTINGNVSNVYRGDNLRVTINRGVSQERGAPPAMPTPEDLGIDDTDASLTHSTSVQGDIITTIGDHGKITINGRRIR